MNSRRASLRVPRFVSDFLLGALLFAAIAAHQAGLDMAGFSAHAAELPWPPEFSTFDAVPPVSLAAGGVVHMPDLVALGVACASLLALNLWFARHVRRVHVSSLRGRHGGQAG